MASELTSPEAALLEPAPPSGLRFPSWPRASAFELRLDALPPLPQILQQWPLPPPPPSSPTWAVWPGSQQQPPQETSDLMDTSRPPLPTMDELSDRFAGLSLSEDAVDGSITDSAMKIIKGSLAFILDRIVEDDMQENCIGCSVNHPSQRRHTCLYEPEAFYFCNNFEKLMKKLYRPWFKYIITKAVAMFHPHLSKSKVQSRQ
nr:uncharacterized protein LOC111848758 [Paramormyrops kingsleyae]